MIAAVTSIEESVLSRYFIFHGLPLAVQSDQADVLAAVQLRLRHFAVDALPDPPQLTFEFHGVPESAPPLIEQPAEPLRLIYELPRGKIYYGDTDDLLYLELDSGFRALCHPRDGYTRIAMPAQHGDLWLPSHLLFMLPFMEQLKRRGLYSIHTAGLCIKGQGVLFPGASGAGKSTLTLTLLRAGFSLLGDDLVFLTPGETGVRMLAFPDEIGVTEQTLGFFPELQPLLAQPLTPGFTKRQLLSEQFYPHEWVAACTPRVLIFPQVSATPGSTLQPMSRDEALLELIPNILLTERRSSQAHLDSLAALVKQCDCYRLETGRDFDTLPTLLTSLLS